MKFDGKVQKLLLTFRKFGETNTPSKLIICKRNTFFNNKFGRPIPICKIYSEIYLIAAKKKNFYIGQNRKYY